MQNSGKVLVFIGLGMAFIGLLLWVGGKYFNWFGRLPGDIKIERGNFQFFAPITSMVLISIVLSILIWLFNKFFK